MSYRLAAKLWYVPPGTGGRGGGHSPRYTVPKWKNPQDQLLILQIKPKGGLAAIYHEF